MIKRNLKTISVFLLIPFIFYVLNTLTSPSCDIFLYLDNDVFDIIARLIKHGLVFIVGISVAIILYKYFRSRSNLAKHKTSYFAIVSILIFSPIAINCFENIIDYSILKSICEKTEANPMIVKCHNLNSKEYDLIQREQYLFPPLPTTADSITIDYYHDGFLPDYMINIKCWISQNDFASLNKGWMVIKTNNLRGLKYIEYSDSVD